MYNSLGAYNAGIMALVEPPLKTFTQIPTAVCKSAVCTCQSNESFMNPNINWEVKSGIKTSAPEINGPPFWFTLHNGAAHLPEYISPISMERIRGFIDGIPEMQPCTKCSEHARAYIEKNRSKIDKFTTGEEVFAFFVDFHNFVNKRLGKRIVSLEEAKAMYKDGQNIAVMTYGLNKENSA